MRPGSLVGVVLAATLLGGCPDQFKALIPSGKPPDPPPPLWEQREAPSAATAGSASAVSASAAEGGEE